MLANFDDERKIPRGTKDIKDIYQDTSRPYLDLATSVAQLIQPVGKAIIMSSKSQRVPTRTYAYRDLDRDLVN